MEKILMELVLRAKDNKETHCIMDIIKNIKWKIQNSFIQDAASVLSLQCAEEEENLIEILSKEMKRP